MESSDKGNDHRIEKADDKLLALLDKRMMVIVRGDFWQSIGYNGRCGTDGFPVPGELVKELRLKRRLNQEELASLLGCDRSMVAKMEKNNHGLDSLTTRRDLAKALEVSPLAFGLVGLNNIKKQVLYDPSLLKTALKLHREVYFSGGDTGGTAEVDNVISNIYVISKGINHRNRDILEVLCHYNQLGLDLANQELTYGAADRYARNALAIGEALNDKSLLASTALRYCAVLYAKGDIDRSMEYAERALSYEGSISQTLASTVFAAVCRPFAVKGDKRTQGVLRKAYKIMRSNVVDENTTFLFPTLAFVHMRQAEVHINSGEYQEALDVLDLANENRKYRRRQCIIEKLQSRALYGLGKYRQSADTAQSALAVAREVNSQAISRDIEEIYGQLLKSPAKDTLAVKSLGMSFA